MRYRAALASVLMLLLVCPAAGAYDETYEEAVRLFTKREYRSAIPYLETYAAQKPDPAAYYMLGYAYYQLRDFKKSRENFDQTYLIDPAFTSEKVPVLTGRSEEDRRLIHDLLELSGVRNQMGYYADLVISGIPEVLASMSSEKAGDTLSHIVKDSFRFSRLYPSVVDYFENRFQRAHATAAMQWLRSPLGRKLTALEIEAGDLAQMRRRSAVSGQGDLVLTDRRRVCIERLEKALHATELTVGIISTALLEMLKGMQAELQGSGKMNSEEIDRLIHTVTDNSRQEIVHDVHTSLARTYQCVSDAELDAMISFYESPEGRWFNDTGIEALCSAIGKASREAGVRLGRALVFRRIAL